MNNKRRKEVTEIIDCLSGIRDELDVMRDEEQDAHDNLPESLRNSEGGQAVQKAATALDSAKNNIKNAVGDLSGLI